MLGIPNTHYLQTRGMITDGRFISSLYIVPMINKVLVLFVNDDKEFKL